jgi:Transcriptional regulator SbtR-like, C-terminal domain
VRWRGIHTRANPARSASAIWAEQAGEARRVGRRRPWHALPALPTQDQLVLAVIEDGLWEIAALGDQLRDQADPVAGFQRWLASYVAQGAVFEGLAHTLVAPQAADGDGKDACRAAKAAGADLFARAVAAGQFGADTDIDDVLDLAAAIAWVAEQPDREAGQQSRLLRILVDGLRITPSERSAQVGATEIT